VPSRPSSARPVRTILVLLLVVVAIFGALGVGSRVSDASFVPKLALDLEGGTQIILTPVTSGGETVTEEDINQAISIIRQRVDSSGVAEAEITSQGGRNIVVALPGNPDEATLELVRSSAQLRFRPVLVELPPGPIEDADGDGQPDPEPTQPAEELSDTPATEPTSPSDLAWVTPAVERAYLTLDCTDPANRVGGGGDDPAKALVTCSPDGLAKYVLGPVEIEGTDIAQASSGLRTTAQGVVTNEWVVQLEFTAEGSRTFSETTQRLLTLPPPQNRFAMVLDRLVISSPSVNEPITNGQAEISGTFTRETAATLANQLNFGSLPLSLEVQSEEQVSATLGEEQLQRGVLAGLIGLVLVVVYTMLTYRGLAVVTVASLLVAGLITYGIITLLSWLQGYRLSLPGVAGLIVSVGIIADSFIVYFERVRDEVREGRHLTAAVESGWARARRTILASDSVNFLAAVVLYLLAVGGVRGFAFTLGLTTIVDIFVVAFFTHPLMQLLSRTRFFGGGHRLSGLDPVHLGATVSAYRGRGQFRAPAGARRQTIAERRAAEEAGQVAEEAGSPPPVLQPTGVPTDDEALGRTAEGASSGRSSAGSGTRPSTGSRPVRGSGASSRTRTKDGDR
jgi:preprotein translocase subunit SecD